MNPRKPTSKLQAIIMGLLVIVAGIFIILIGLDVIPSDPSSKHAPGWVIAAAGLVFFSED